MVLFRKSVKAGEEVTQGDQDLIDLREAAQKAQLPEAAAVTVTRELERLEKTDSSSPEYTIGLNYIE